MKLSRGIVSIPMVVGLIIMAIAIPVASKLALNNQDNRNRAAGAHPSNCTCVGGRYENEGGTCAFVDERCAMGTVVPSARPSSTIKQCRMDMDCGGQMCVNGYCRSKCTGSAQCGTGQKCSSGFCLSGCVTDSGCVSEGGRCNAGVCTGPVTTPSNKKVNGAICNLDSDCASAHCIGNYPFRKCAASETNRPNGSGCLKSSVCSSGACKLGKCVGTKAQGSICKVDSECIVGNCLNGKCGTMCFCPSGYKCMGGSLEHPNCVKIGQL